METFGSGPCSPLGEFPSAQFLAMTADLPIFVRFEPVEIPFATTEELSHAAARLLSPLLNRNGSQTNSISQTSNSASNSIFVGDTFVATRARSKSFGNHRDGRPRQARTHAAHTVSKKTS
jgi:hypothetical protein